MSYLKKFVKENEAIERTLTIGEESETVFFRHLTAAERQKLVNGQKVLTKEGQTEVEIELGSNERTRQQMVYYCVVNADGSQYFKNTNQVAELPMFLVSALWKLANEINKEEEDPGK